jgi:hypothetical protein
MIEQTIKPIIQGIIKSIIFSVAEVTFSLFKPSGSDSLITSDGNTFKVRD